MVGACAGQGIDSTIHLACKSTSSGRSRGSSAKAPGPRGRSPVGAIVEPDWSRRGERPCGAELLGFTRARVYQDGRGVSKGWVATARLGRLGVPAVAVAVGVSLLSGRGS